MKNYKHAYFLAAFCFVPLAAAAGPSAKSAIGNNEGASSGDNAARAGMAVFNSMHPGKEIPLQRGSVVQDTLHNIGAGQSPGDAFRNAARDDSGVTPADAQPDTSTSSQSP